ncbi:MAG: hypothetical protein JAZ02_19325 [Candidatus Thiodiazotropha endolucinida]|nr:hypothetical protein [Candidatus Thiodiazotropha endolucinida]
MPRILKADRYPRQDLPLLPVLQTDQVIQCLPGIGDSIEWIDKRLPFALSPFVFILRIPLLQGNPPEK